MDATGTAYQSQDYNNVCYTGNTVDGTQEWTPDRTVTLSGEPATLYAYYPWTEGVDVEAVPVDMTTADQNDWMYATPVTGLSDANAGATVSLHHALANIRLTLYKENYSGAGVVSAYSFQSDAFATGGTLNAKTGTFDALTGEGAALTRTVDYTLTDKASATAFDCMVVPTGASDDIDVSVTVDGHTYTSTVAAISLTREVAYNLTLKLSSTGLSVTSVSLVDWNEVDLGEEDFTPVVDATDYSDWVKLTYYVDDAAQPVDLVCTVENEGLKIFDIANVANMAVLENSAARAATEPVEITPTYQYTFSTTGIHTVYMKFTDMTRLPDGAFAQNENLMLFELPQTIKEIGDGAFGYCSMGIYQYIQSLPTEEIEKLESADNTTIYNYIIDNIGSSKIYSSTLKVGDYSFCQSFLTIDLSEISLTGIGDGAFLDCATLPFTLNLDNSLRTIGNEAFQNCTGLTGTLTIPNSVTEIGEYTFYNCTGLTGKLTIPESVQTIGKGAFRNCTGLIGELVIPNSVTEIGGHAFASCDGLTTITFGSGLQKIEKGVFYYCTGLTGTLTIPNSVTEIGDEIESQSLDGAFEHCTGITDVIIGSGVSSIGESTFKDCSGMISIELGSDLSTIGTEAFYGCTNLSKVVSNNITPPSIVHNSFNGIATGGLLIVPTGYFDIYSNTRSWFNYDGDFIENGWTCLEKNNYILVNGIYYSNDGLIVLGNNGTLSGIVTIKDGVEKISNYAFSRCKNITDIVIPNSVTEIGKEAFCNCSGLKEVTIPNSVASLGTRLFRFCTVLTKVVLGSGVRTIVYDDSYLGHSLFYGCSSLTTIISKAMKAPNLIEFKHINENGVLIVPTDATGYDTWMDTSDFYLGKYNWTIQYSNELVTE